MPPMNDFSTAPINYSGLLTQINAQPLMQGLVLRNDRQQLNNAQAERAERKHLAEVKFTQQQEEDKVWHADLADLAADFTPEKLRDTMWKHPDKQEALSNGFSTYSRSVQQDVIKSTASVLSALASGNPDLAGNVLQERRDTLVKGNINSDQTDALYRLVKSDDPADRQKAYAMLGTIMSGAVGPEHAAGMMETMGIGAKAEDRRLDNERQAAAAAETARHNRVSEGVASGNLALSRQREGRVSRNSGKGSTKSAKLPSGFILD
jgi:hypothetical protein